LRGDVQGHTVKMDSDAVDILLERYLHLLHEYTTLREQLNALQRGIYQNIARANFAAERGLRFGRDHYDDRMQASRLLAVTTGEKGSLDFSIGYESAADTVAESSEADQDLGHGEEEHKDARDEKAVEQPIRKPHRDPLKWFGLITPSTLRQAQTQSVQAVEDIIPRLVSINIQMTEVEIEVRRARKKRTKAETAAAKNAQENTTSASGVTA
jgi:hypothetical protein